MNEIKFRSLSVWDPSERIKVIGNIYENPLLIGNKNEI